MPKDNPKKKLKQRSIEDAMHSSPPPPPPPKRKKTVQTPAPKVPAKRKKPAPVPQSDSGSDIGAVHFQPRKGHSVSSGDESEIVQSPLKKRRKRPAAVVLSDDEEDDVPSVRKPKRLKKRSPSPIVVDSDSDDAPPRKAPSRLQKGPPKRKARPEPETDEDDLSEDRIIEQRLRTRDKKTAFQKGLERLKRKKQGKPIQDSEASGSESDSDEPFDGAKEDGSESEHDSLFDEPEEDDSDEINDENFVIDDDQDVSSLLPTHFRSQQDLVHHFKTIFQLFVHLAVQLPHERKKYMQLAMTKTDDDYFSTALNTCRRKLNGIRDSSVASSTWRPEFRASLEALPRLNLFKLDFSVPSCDACHFSSRVSTLRGNLSGPLYDRVGFEPIIDSDDEAPDNGKKKKKGKEKKKSSKKQPEYLRSVHLGRFCAKRTRVFHDLSHWEWNLFKNVENEIDDLHDAKRKGKAFVRVAYANGRQPPKDLSDADAIMEWLDERKMVDREWQKLKKLMESATQLDVMAKRGEDVD
ncbi:hypothetical protein CYLTODRAFT_450081 [Cylindrobasidium torrendii FP15055 ss-10]|uniref:DUF4211 domain-containing protein n=1 Tax=Cylindrobasidium torrendii FP15055 ss-10 TaxID=1314674 RepID=A0A0D7BPN3_9AGAR|nr:hypothetical protein CYLTODRAFT_450081 [Cylindrobasidium torrendii FP15055 ss-10]